MNEKHFSLFRLGVASIDSSHFQTLLTPQTVLCASLFRFRRMTLRQVIFGAMRISISCLLRVSRQGPMMSVTSGAGVMSGLPNGWPHMGILHTE